MLSTSDHHRAPAKRNRSPPAAPGVGDVFTSSSPAAKKTKTDDDDDLYAAWRVPPLTPSRRKASTILASNAACRDLIDDIGRRCMLNGGVDVGPNDLDDLEALGQAAYRLFVMVRNVMDRLPNYDRRMRITLPRTIQTSREVQTDAPIMTPTPDSPPATAPGSVGTPDDALPERGLSNTTTAETAAPDSRGRPEPARPAQRTKPVTHRPPVKGRPPRSAPPPRATTQVRGGPRSRPVARLIVRYGDAGTLRDRPRPHSAILRHALNVALGGEWIAGVSYSRTGQLVLHTKAPFTAQQLVLRGDTLRPVIRSSFGLVGDPRPVFKTDAVWSKVVVHRVPLPPSGDSMEAMDVKLQSFFADVCSSNGFDSRLVRKMQLLCPKGEEEEHFCQSTDSSPRHLSVLLCIADNKLATRLLRDSAFWQGAHCRVSTYRPRNSG